MAVTITAAGIVYFIKVRRASRMGIEPEVLYDARRRRLSTMDRPPIEGSVPKSASGLPTYEQATSYPAA